MLRQPVACSLSCASPFQLDLRLVRFDNRSEHRRIADSAEDSDVRNYAVPSDHTREILLPWKERDLLIEGDDVVVAQAELLAIALDLLSPSDEEPEVRRLGQL